MFQYAQADESLTAAGVTPAGIGKGTVFDIVRRTFVFVSEAEAAEFRWCTSPHFESKGAKGGATVSRKEVMFCFRPDPNPQVAVVRCRPADLGFHPSGEAALTSQPYCAATLNLVAQGETGLFTGQWRALSCACAECQYGNGTPCTSRGEGFPPFPWEVYTVARGPAVPRKGISFIAAMVDAELVEFDAAASAFSVFAESTGEFIRKKLHRFRSVKAATDYVIKRTGNSQPGNWVEQALLAIPGIDLSANVNEQAAAPREQLAKLHQKATSLGWKPADCSWDEFVGRCLRAGASS